MGSRYLGGVLVCQRLGHYEILELLGKGLPPVQTSEVPEAVLDAASRIASPAVNTRATPPTHRPLSTVRFWQQACYTQGSIRSGLSLDAEVRPTNLGGHPRWFSHDAGMWPGTTGNEVSAKRPFS